MVTRTCSVEVNLNEDVLSPMAWHIDDMAISLKNNFNLALREKKSNGWVIVGMAKSHEEAREIIANMKQILSQSLGLEAKLSILAQK